jgi:hypothetical protein
MSETSNTIWSATALARDEATIRTAALSVRQRKLLALLNTPMTVDAMSTMSGIAQPEVEINLQRFHKLGLASSDAAKFIATVDLRKSPGFGWCNRCIRQQDAAHHWWRRTDRSCGSNLVVHAQQPRTDHRPNTHHGCGKTERCTHFTRTCTRTRAPLRAGRRGNDERVRLRRARCE